MTIIFCSTHLLSDLSVILFPSVVLQICVSSYVVPTIVLAAISTLLIALRQRISYLRSTSSSTPLTCERRSMATIMATESMVNMVNTAGMVMARDVMAIMVFTVSTEARKAKNTRRSKGHSKTTSVTLANITCQLCKHHV